MTFICYPKCTSCQKAKKWLDDHHINYHVRDIKQANPSYEELREWHKISQLPLKRFFNTSGLLYKSLKLKERLSAMSEDEQLQLLANVNIRVDDAIQKQAETISCKRRNHAPYTHSHQ